MTLPSRFRRRGAFWGSAFLVTIVTFVRVYESTYDYSEGHHEIPAILLGRVSWHDFNAGGRGLTDSSTGLGRSTGLNASLQSQKRPYSAGQGTHPYVPTSKGQVSARAALSQQIDLDRCKVHQLDSTLVQANNTVVAAYYRVLSKHSHAEYDVWIRNFMSIEDPVVVFTQSSMVEPLMKMRAHAANRTVVVECEIDILPITSFGQGFWEYQLNIDPEASIHRSYQVFWIWLSKTWWTVQAVHLNFFSSSFFLYSDIGSFRTDKFNHKAIIRYPNVVPDGTILWMAHRRPQPPPTYIWTNKSAAVHFYHSGSLGAGKGDAWIVFHAKFSAALDSFVAEGGFVGEDQCILQATCLLHPHLCAYVLFTQVDDDRYFGLRYVLHSGPDSAVDSEDKKYRLWRPPGWNASSAGR